MNWKIVALLILVSFSSTITYAQDDTQLIIDGNTSIELTELETRSIIVRDNASLTLRNVHLQTIFYNGSDTVKIQLYDNSNLIITNSSIPASVVLFNQSRVEVINSTVFHAFWCPIHKMFHNSSGIFSQDYSTFNVINSKIGYIRADGINVGNVEGGSVMEIWPSGNPDSNVRVVAEKCNVGRVHLNEPQRNISNIRIGYYEDLLFDQQIGASIQLHKTELTSGMSLTFKNSLVEIENCDIVVLEAIDCPRVEVTDSYIWDIVLWDPKNIRLDNCSVDYFTSINEERCEIILDQCSIIRFDGYVSHFYSLTATDSVIDRFYQGRRAEMTLNDMKINFLHGDMEYLSLSGNFNLENNTLPVLIFGKSLNANITVQREYPINVQHLNTPIEDTLIEVLDENEVIKSTRTDSEGYACIQISFFERYIHEDKLLHETNLTKNYTLRVIDQGTEYTQKLGVYTITPIIIEVEHGVDKTVLVLIALFCLILSLILVRKVRT